MFRQPCPVCCHCSVLLQILQLRLPESCGHCCILSPRAPHSQWGRRWGRSRRSTLSGRSSICSRHSWQPCLGICLPEGSMRYLAQIPVRSLACSGMHNQRLPCMGMALCHRAGTWPCLGAGNHHALVSHVQAQLLLHAHQMYMISEQRVSCVLMSLKVLESTTSAYHHAWKSMHYCVCSNGGYLE